MESVTLFVGLAVGALLSCSIIRNAFLAGRVRSLEADLARREEVMEDDRTLCIGAAEGRPYTFAAERGTPLRAVQDLRQKYDALHGPVAVPSAFPQWESSPGAWCDNCGEVYAGD